MLSGYLKRFCVRIVIFAHLMQISAPGLYASPEAQDYQYCLDIRTIDLERQAFEVEVARRLKSNQGTREKVHSVTLENGLLKGSFLKQPEPEADCLYSRFKTEQLGRLDPNGQFGHIYKEFENPAAEFSFIYKLTGLGLLKVNRRGETFFTQDSDLSTLSAYDLVLKSTGNMYIQTLKVAGLRLSSPKTEIGGVVVAERLLMNHEVENNGGMQVSQLTGRGKLVNHASLTMPGTLDKFAELGVREFRNKKSQILNATPKIEASYLNLLSTNEIFVNGTGALFDVSDLRAFDNNIHSQGYFNNKGNASFRCVSMFRKASNEGFWQAREWSSYYNSFHNKEFGQLKLRSPEFSSDFLNEGEITTSGKTTIARGHNKGKIKSDGLGSVFHVNEEMINDGEVSVEALTGPGTFKNHRILRFIGDGSLNISHFLNQRTREDLAAQVRGANLSVGGNNITFVNAKDSDVLCSTLQFINPDKESRLYSFPWQQPGYKPNFSNFGRIKGDVLDVDRNLFENSGIIAVQKFKVNGGRFLNRKDAVIDVQNDIQSDVAEFVNDGTMTVTDGTYTQNQGHFTNNGTWNHKGDIKSAMRFFTNTGTIKWENGEWEWSPRTWFENEGKWFLTSMRSLKIIEGRSYPRDNGFLSFPKNKGELHLDSTSLYLTELNNPAGGKVVVKGGGNLEVGKCNNDGSFEINNATAKFKDIQNKAMGNIRALNGAIEVETAENQGVIQGNGLSLTVADKMTNEGQMRVKNLSGKKGALIAEKPGEYYYTGSFYNRSTLEFESTRQDPAILSIPTFNNTKHTPALQPLVKGDNILVTQENTCFYNSKYAEIQTPIKFVFALPPNTVFTDPALKTILNRRPEFNNLGLVKADIFELNRNYSENSGTIEANTFNPRGWRFQNLVGAILHVGTSIDATLNTVQNDGTMIVDKGRYTQKTGNFINTGEWQHTGDIDLGSTKLVNKKVAASKATINWQKGRWDFVPARYYNQGNWQLDQVTSVQSLNIQNDGILQLKNSALNFSELINNHELLLNSGQYSVGKFPNQHLIRFLENNWTFTDDATSADSHRLIVGLLGFGKQVGEIESQKNLIYDIHVLMPTKLSGQSDITFSRRHPRHIRHLNCVTTPGKVTLWSDPISLLKPEPKPAGAGHDIEFSKIGHLDLSVNGDFTSHYSFKAPTLSLRVTGSLKLGKDNETLGTIAATKGSLSIISHKGIDGRYGKFYGAGPLTYIEDQSGGITIGAPLAKGPFLYGLNGSYIASGGQLHISTPKDLDINYGQLISQRDQFLNADGKIINTAGVILSESGINFNTPDFSNTRAGTYNQPVGNWTWAYSGCYNISESSDQAVVKALGTINFNVDKGLNLASSILAGKDIKYKHRNNPNAYKPIQPATFSSVGRTNWAYGCNDKVGYQQSSSPCSSYPSTILAGQKIQINTGEFVVGGVMNAGFDIGIQATGAGLFANISRSRQTLNPTRPQLINITQYVQNQARSPGLLTLAANGAVGHEFPFGTPFIPAPRDVVLLGNPQQPAAPQIPLGLGHVFNPLAAINLDMHIQSILAAVAGQVHAAQVSGNNLSKVLWGNAGKWRLQTNKAIMSEEDLANTNESMLIMQYQQKPTGTQLDTILSLAPGDINPYQSSGDMVAPKFECVTGGDQAHQNTRIVAYGPGGITLKSKGGSVNLETQSYTIEHEEGGVRTIEQHAMPQQQLLAPVGAIKVTGHRNISRTGDLMVSGGNIDEIAETGSLRKNPLVLQKLVSEHRESGGFMSSKEHNETSLTHSAVPSTTAAGSILSEKAAISIEAVAPQDSAGQEIAYNAPKTRIEGLLLADRKTSNTRESGGFTEKESRSSQDTPFGVPANINAPLVRFIGDEATVNASVQAKEMRDETEKGVKFVAKVAQMLVSGQNLTTSPLSSADVGFEAGYETMIPTMLMVEKIVRAKDHGQMVFESVVMDHNRTEIIGKFIETTYHLKQWQTTWSHIDQVIPDAALVVVALAVAIATQGAGIKFMAPMLEGVTAATGMTLSATGVAMVNAGFSAVCSTAVASGLRSGDPFQTLQQLVSPSHLKSLAVTMASAGLLHGIGGLLDINMKPEFKGFIDHVQEKALSTSIDTFLNVAINNVPVDQAIGDAIKQIPIKAAAAYMANQIGSLSLKGKISDITAKAAHGAVGGVMGFVAKPNQKGFISGVTGAVATQIMGDLILSDSLAISDAAAAKLRQAGSPRSPENMERAIQTEMHRIGDWTKVAAGGIAAILGLDPSVAIGSAANAVDHDLAIRGGIYATAEYKALLKASSLAIAQVKVRQEVKLTAPSKARGARKQARKLKEDAESNRAIDLILDSMGQPVNKYQKIIFELAQEQPNVAKKTSKPLMITSMAPGSEFIYPVIEEISYTTAVERLNNGIDAAAWIPNPFGMACLATGLSRDLYQGKTTAGDILFNTALAYGTLKGIKLAGQGVKFIYQKSNFVRVVHYTGDKLGILFKSGKKFIADMTVNPWGIPHNLNYKLSGKVPFVNNPEAGYWTSSSSSGNLWLTPFEGAFKDAFKAMSINPKAPFNVVAHGIGQRMVAVNNKIIHPKALRKDKLKELQESGRVKLNAVHLARVIRTAPGYTKGQHINLLACDAAAADGIAQQLATRMGVPVSAFSGSIVPIREGGFQVLNIENGAYGVMNTFYPNSGWKVNLMPLAAVPLLAAPALMLSGDERNNQDAKIVNREGVREAAATRSSNGLFHAFANH